MDKEVEEFLEHFGVKGMHWGIRNDDGSRNTGQRLSGVSRSIHREASKDVVEFVRAKQFTGQGAGNRRKHINALVESKKKKSSAYARTFDHLLPLHDVGREVKKAQKERRSIDRRDRTKKRAGFLARRFTGEMGTQAAFTAVALGGAAFIASPKGQSVMKKSVKSVKVAVESRRLQRSVNRLINLSRP